MNDNYEQPEIQKLWLQMLMAQKRIAEEAALSVSIMQRIGEIIFMGDAATRKEADCDPVVQSHTIKQERGDQ